MLAKLRLLAGYREAKVDARDEKKMGERTRYREAIPPPLLVFRALLSFFVPILQHVSPKLKNACYALVFLLCAVEECSVLSHQLQIMN